MAKSDADELRSLIEKVKVTNVVGPSKSLTAAAASSPSEGPQVKGVRFLAKQDSEVSVGSDGSLDIYKMLKNTGPLDTATVCYGDFDELQGSEEDDEGCDDDDEGSDHDDEGLDSIPEFTPVPPNAILRKAEMENSSEAPVIKRPAMKRPAAATSSEGTVIKMPAMKKPAAAPRSKAPVKEAAAADNSIEYLSVFAKGQSYICVRDEQGKKKLWVAISQKQSPNHVNLIKEIIAQKPTSKQASLELRAALL